MKEIKAIVKTNMVDPELDASATATDQQDVESSPSRWLPNPPAEFWLLCRAGGFKSDVET